MKSMKTVAVMMAAALVASGAFGKDLGETTARVGDFSKAGAALQASVEQASVTTSDEGVTFASMVVETKKFGKITIAGASKPNQSGPIKAKVFRDGKAAGEGLIEVSQGSCDAAACWTHLTGSFKAQDGQTIQAIVTGK